MPGITLAQVNHLGAGNANAFYAEQIDAITDNAVKSALIALRA